MSNVCVWSYCHNCLLSMLLHTCKLQRRYCLSIRCSQNFLHTIRCSGARGAKVGSRFSFGLAACFRRFLLVSRSSSSAVCDDDACVSARLSMTSCTHQRTNMSSHNSRDTAAVCIDSGCTHLCAVVRVLDSDVLHDFRLTVFTLFFPLFAAY